MSTESSISPAAAAPRWLDRRQADQTRADYGVCVALFAFYLIDAVFLAFYALLDIGPWWAAGCFAVTGLVVAGGGALVVRRHGAGGLEDPRLVLVQAGTALALTLGVAGVAPALLAPMLMTVIVIIPTAALRVPPRWLALLCTAAAVAGTAIVTAHGGHVDLHTATVGQQVLGGLFLLWTLAKGASVNVAGMALRLQIDDSHRQLSAALARVEELAERDELTGLANRRRVLAALAEERERHVRSGTGFAVALLDIDHFKRINDQHGHAAGDAVLRRVAALMRGALRLPDLVGRLGGEEFLFILPGADAADAARQAAERVRAVIEAEDWSDLLPQRQVTASIGLAVARTGEPPEVLVDRADRAMYRAKAAGRNRVDVEPAAAG